MLTERRAGASAASAPLSEKSEKSEWSISEVPRKKKPDYQAFKLPVCQLNFWLPIIAIAIVVYLFFFFTRGPLKLDGKFDIVFLISPPENHFAVDKFKMQWRGRLFEHVEIDKETRVAIVVAGAEGETEILLQLTNDKLGVELAIENMPPMNQKKPGEETVAFQKMRGEIFNFKGTDRAKLVVIFKEKISSNNRTVTDENARKLRENGVFIYVVYAQDVDGLKEAAEEYAGSTTRIFDAPAIDIRRGRAVEKMSEIVPVIYRDVCSFCRYEDDGRNSCKVEVYKPGMKPDYFRDNGTKCSEIDPGDIKCTVEDCGKECDRQWPWDNDPDCTFTCGKTIKRNPETPPPVQMENCPTKIQCQPCKTTTTTTGKSTGTSNISEEGSGTNDWDNAEDELDEYLTI